MVSNRYIRNKIKHSWQGEVSQDTLNYVSKSMDVILDNIIKNVVSDLNNRVRQKANLKQYKRIPNSIFKKFLGSILKQTSDLNNGEIGKVPIEILSYHRQTQEVIKNV